MPAEPEVGESASDRGGGGVRAGVGVEHTQKDSRGLARNK